MARTATPTTPGPHNHVGPARRDAQAIEGLPIELGHGCLELEAQLAAHVARIVRDQGAEAAGEIVDRLEQNGRVRTEIFRRELMVRGMI